MAAVAAHQVLGAHPAGPVWAEHIRGDRVVVLADGDDPVPAADVGAECTGVLVEQALQSWLREAQSPDRGICQAREVQVQVAEREPRRRVYGTDAGR